MPTSKTPPTAPRPVDMRLRVLDAAERLLRGGRAEFSMRDLAAEAGVSFATPFNQFGSKAAIMHALSARRIDAMAERFERAGTGGDAAERVLAAVEVAAAVMLDEPEVNRAVIGILGGPGGEPGRGYARSQALWARAVGAGDGLQVELAGLARAVLPGQLALAFRGVLSFWTAGEIGDRDLAARARGAASAALLGFVEGPRRAAILAELGSP